MTVKQCDVCRGQKKVRGLGNMMRECHRCTGIGYITESTMDVPPHRDVIDMGMNGTVGEDGVLPVSDGLISTGNNVESFPMDTVLENPPEESKMRKKRSPNKNKLIGNAD